MIIVWGSVECESNSVDDAIAIGLEHVARSRAEPGCLLHSLQVDAENPNRLVFYEEWQDMESLQHHFSVPESKEFVQKLGQLASTTPTMKLFSAEAINR